MTLKNNISEKKHLTSFNKSSRINTDTDRRNLIKISAMAAMALTIAPSSLKAAPAKGAGKIIKVSVPAFLANDECFLSLATDLKKICNISLEILEISHGATVSPVRMIDNGLADMAFTSLCIEKQLPDYFHFFSGIPFGLNCIEFISWIRQDQGQRMLDDAFSKKGLKAWIIRINGSSGGAWHRNEINGIRDYEKKKIIAHGLAEGIFRKLGASTSDYPDENPRILFETGKIDAIEGISPSGIIGHGFERTEGIYYWPGWHSPMETFFMIMKKKRYDSLSQSIKTGIDRLCYSSLSFSTASYSYRNSMKTAILTSIPGIRIKRIPDSILIDMAGIVRETIRNTGDSCPEARIIHDSYMNFFKKTIGWTQLGDEAFSLARSLTITYVDDPEKQ